MKNNLLDLINNSKTILDVREKLLKDCYFKPHHDVDTEATGFWLKKEILPADICYIALYVKPGQGVYLKIDRPIKTKTFEGTPSFEEIMGQIDEFLTEIYGEGWDK